jgi:hypothetical protein
MMKAKMKVLIAGLSIIIVTNVVALGGVAYNRSGQPEALLELTERELGIGYRYGLERDNTGLSLSINCRLEILENDYGYGNSNCWGEPRWLSQEKLVELGFEFENYDKDLNYRDHERVLPKDVYLVLEYDGATYQRVLRSKEQILREEQTLQDNNPDNPEFDERVEQASKNLLSEQNFNSRLFAIDAGLDKTALRKTYADNSRYILVKASIKPAWRFNDDQRTRVGRINDLLIEQINVPLEHRAVFNPVEKAASRRNRNTDGPRYQVQVAFGKRLEPWVVRVERFDPKD